MKPPSTMPANTTTIERRARSDMRQSTRGVAGWVVGLGTSGDAAFAAISHGPDARTFVVS